MILVKTALNETRATSQIDLFKEAKEKYGVDKFVLSSWSPPYMWKTIQGVPFGRVGSSINRLTHNKYENFAHYILAYIEYCKSHGIDIYAISPQNEPEFPTTAVCIYFKSLSFIVMMILY